MPIMQRRHHLAALLLSLLLVWGCGAATGGAEEADARQEPACDPSTLAGRIAHFCVSHMGSAPCCEALVDSVDHCGGVPSLCIVSGEAAIVLNRLNSSSLLTAYAACGGLRGGGANFATACGVPPSRGVDVLPVIPVIPVIPLPPPAPRRRRKQPTPPPPPPTRPTNQPPPAAPRRRQLACDSPTLSGRIAHHCVAQMGSAPCCEALVDSVDLCGGVPCLCSVADQPAVVLNDLNSSFLLTVYNACGGLRARGAHFAAACDPPPYSDSDSEDVLIRLPPPAPRRKHPPPAPAPAPAGGGIGEALTPSSRRLLPHHGHGLHRDPYHRDDDLGAPSWTSVRHHCGDDVY